MPASMSLWGARTVSAFALLLSSHLTAAPLLLMSGADGTDQTNNAIVRVDPVTSAVTTFSTGIGRPGTIAVDSVRRRVYWTDFDIQAVGGTGVFRANLDGSNTQLLMTFQGSAAYGVAVNPAAGHLYVSGANGTSNNNTAIIRTDLDGLSPVTISTGIGTPAAMAIDAQRGKLYWTDLDIDTVVGGGSGVFRANLDGSDIELLLRFETNGAFGIAVDPGAGFIYASGAPGTSSNNTALIRARLDGSDVMTVSTGVGTPSAIALDLVEDVLYWTDQDIDRFGSVTSGSGVFRSRLDGGDPELLTQFTSSAVFGLAVLRDGIPLSSPGAGLLITLGLLTLLPFRMRRANPSIERR